MKVLHFECLAALLIGALLQCEASTNLRSVTSPEQRFLQDPSEELDEMNAAHEEDEGEEDSEANMEKEEDDSAVNAKNLASEIDYRDNLRVEEERDENAAHKKEKQVEAAPGCAVTRSGKLDVAPDPTDVLTTVPQSVSIGKKILSVNYEGRADVPSLRIPIVEIKTPIETLVRTQRCFRLFHKTKPYVFCAANSKERDSWVADLYKAVFCINSGKTVGMKAQKKKTVKGEEVKLPARSTKIQRWMKQLREANEEAAKQAEAEEEIPRPKKKEVEEIEIIGAENSSPKLTVNGDDVVMPHPSDGNVTMNEGNQE